MYVRAGGGLQDLSSYGRFCSATVEKNAVSSIETALTLNRQNAMPTSGGFLKMSWACRRIVMF
jgi:hypothetical protein